MFLIGYCIEKGKIVSMIKYRHQNNVQPEIGKSTDYYDTKIPVSGLRTLDEQLN